MRVKELWVNIEMGKIGSHKYPHICGVVVKLSSSGSSGCEFGAMLGN